MYLDYFGLKEKPFSLTPDPRFLFLSDSHRKALDHLVYGIQEYEGFIMIVGDIGTGKTTICRELLDRLEPGVASALILNPLLSEQELLEAIVEDFGIGAAGEGDAQRVAGREGDSSRVFESLDAQTQNALELNPMMPGRQVLENILRNVEPERGERPTKKELIDRLNSYLLGLVENGGNAVLIIDEAQNLSPQVLEQIRILSNLETTRHKLLQIVLVGQLELRRKLEQPELRQLNQRISIRYQLNPLDFGETKRYMEHRLFVAGSNSSVTFTDGAYRAIYDYSRGVPRLVNLICERCLLAAYVDQSRQVDADTVARCRDSLEGNLERAPGIPSEDRGQDSPEARSPEPQDDSREDDTEPSEADRPEDAVEQPWEREKGASGLGGILARHRPAVIFAAAVILGLLGGWWMVGRKTGPAPGAGMKAEQASSAAGTQAPAGRNVQVPAVRLAYSIQIGAYQRLEDSLEQMRLLNEQDAGSGLYVVPLHLVQLGGRWYRLFMGGFPSSSAARERLNQLADRGIIKPGSARILQTPLAFNLGEYGSREAAESVRRDYMERYRIPAYVMRLDTGTDSESFRLYAGAFENEDQASFLADRIREAGIEHRLVERLGYWALN